MNKDIGWIACGYGESHFTTDGGDSWFPVNFGSHINRFHFIDELNGFTAGQTIYKYNGSYITSINHDQPISNFELSQNYPNPFNPTTKIRFSIPNINPANVNFSDGLLYTTLKIYDSLGNLITVLVNEEMRPGENEFEFNAGNLSFGVYYYQLIVGNFTESKKMLLLK